MLSFLGVMNLETGLGRPLHEGELSNSLLVMGVFSAINSFVVGALGSQGFQRATLEDNQLLVFEPAGIPDSLAYVAVADLHDNQEYIQLKVEAIHRHLRPFLTTELNRLKTPPEVNAAIKELVKYTQSLTNEVHQDIDGCVKDFLEQLGAEVKICDVFVMDVDSGVVYEYDKSAQPEEASSRNFLFKLQNMLTEVGSLWHCHPTKREHWREAFVIDWLGRKTDFMLAVWLKYNSSKSETRQTIEVGVRELNRRIESTIAHLISERPF